jgi:surface carbohydrate biosynthesis protein
MKIKFLKKVKDFFFVLLKCKISLTLKKKKYVIFDKTSSEEFCNLFNLQDVFILNTRLSHISKIYFSRKIFFSILKNFFNHNLKKNYLIAVLNEINPEIVITMIDNSYSFWNLAEYFQGKIKFIGVQNAVRGDLVENPNIWKKEVSFTNYVCFSEFDIEAINSLKNIKVKKFFIGGSLRSSNFHIITNKNDYKKIKVKYDICFIGKQDFKEIEGEEGRKKELIDLLQKTAKYVKKFNKKIIIASKTDKNKEEEEFYNKTFAGSLFKINWRTDKYRSYEAIKNSNVTLGLSSTILREAFIFETKILCCEYRKRPSYWDPFSNFNHLNDVSYDNLEKKLNLLFKIDLNEYYKRLDKKKDYYMKDIDTNFFLKNLIKNKSQFY